MKNIIPRLMEYASRKSWAIELGCLQKVVGVLTRHSEGIRNSAAQIASIMAAAGTDASPEDDVPTLEIVGDTAVLRIEGVVAKHARLVNDISLPRGCSYDLLGDCLQQAMDDPAVAKIFLLIESPGGWVEGTADFSDAVYRASQIKPVVAYAHDLACSAAYWIGSQASLFLASQGAIVGSIGVYSVMVDDSSAVESEGLKVTIVRSGSNKGVGQSGVPITDENIAAHQRIVDGEFGMFLSAIGRGRPELDGETLKGAADGRVFLSSEAMALNLIDGIATLDEAFSATCPIRPGGPKSITPGIVPDPTNEESTMFGFKKAAVVVSEPDAAAVEAAQAAEQAAVAADRERVAAISALLEPLGDVPGIADLSAAATKDGLSLEAVKVAGFDVLVKAMATMSEQAEKATAELQARLDAIASSGAALSDIPDPGASDSDAGSSVDDGKPGTYSAAVNALIKGGKGKGQAHSKAAQKFPRSHVAWIDAGCPEA